MAKAEWRVQERLDAVLAEMKSLHTNAAGGALGLGAQRRWDELSGECDSLESELRGLQEHKARMLERLEAGELHGEHGDDRSGPAPRDTLPTSGFGGHLSQMRGSALRAIERAANVPDFGKERATKLVERDRNGLASRWALAASDPSYESAWVSLLVDPERGHLGWTDRQRAAWDESQTVSRAMNVGTPGSGGFMVPFTLDPALVLTSDGTAGNPVRALARKVTTMTNSWNGVTSTGVTASWDAEAEEVSDDTPTLLQPTVECHKLTLFVPFSIEASQDIPDLVGELRGVMEDERAVKEALAFTTGSGTGEPEGFVTALDGTASEVAPATAETFAVADIYALIEALPPRHRPNAAWQSNLSIANLVRQFDAAGGSDLWAQLTAGAPATLVGKRWAENSDMDPGFNPAATADNFILAIGNWSRYVIADRVGATAEIVPHLFGAAGRPTGERGLFFFTRVGGAVTDINAFRCLNVATTA